MDKTDLGNLGNSGQVEVIEMIPCACYGHVCTSVGRQLWGRCIVQLPCIAVLGSGGDMIICQFREIMDIGSVYYYISVPNMQ